MNRAEPEIEYLVLKGLLGNIETAPDADKLRRSLALSVQVDTVSGRLQPGPSEIAAQCGVPLADLVQHQIVVDKDRGVYFLRMMGDITSPNQLKKLTLKQGRYEARFSRPLTRWGIQNIYTYAELLVLVNRKLLIERLNKAAAQLLGGFQ